MQISSSLFTKFQVDDQVRSVASSLQTCKDRLAHGTGNVSSNCSWHAPATGRLPDPTSRRAGSRSMRCLRVVMRTRVSELPAVCSRDKFVVGRTLRAGFSFFFRLRFQKVSRPSLVQGGGGGGGVHCWISVCCFSGEHCCTHITTRCSDILVYVFFGICPREVFFCLFVL